MLAEAATGHPPVILRAPGAPVQVVHVDDVASALLLAVEQSLAGVYNVASDGWLASEDADALHPRRHLPGIPYEAAERVLQVMWGSGLGDAPPAIVPYLAYPWVVANDRIRDAGWAPSHPTRKRSSSHHPRRQAASSRGSPRPPRSSWVPWARRGG